MDVFSLRDRVIDEYRRYVSGFVTVREPRVKKYVQDYFEQGRLWPEPPIQLNPAFRPGRSVDQLVADRVLHEECARVFRRKDSPDAFGEPIRLHQHQDEAITAAATGKSYVLTTGTGSGKSLSYFIPIVDHVLRSGPGRWILLAALYGLTRDELRYVLNPVDVYGPDFAGETFRVLKEKAIRQCGEYRTRRLVLEAWDRLGLEPRNRDALPGRAPARQAQRGAGRRRGAAGGDCIITNYIKYEEARQRH